MAGGPRSERLHDPTIESEPPLPTRRSEIAQASGFNALVGVWLLASPWILNLVDGDVRVLSVVLGAAVAVLASLRALRAWRAQWLSWLNALIGAILVVAAVTVTDSWRSTWNFLVVGLLVLGLGAWSAGAGPSRGREHKPPL